MSERLPDSLTGVWHGLYMYPLALEPGSFVATLMDVGGALSGMTHEASNNDGLPVRQLHASIEGRREGQSVQFTKRYIDGGPAWGHAVHYSGVLSSDRSEIEGIWDIAGEWSGRFLMIRSSGRPDAVRRKAFQEA